jgi:hypothetical protein
MKYIIAHSDLKENLNIKGRNENSIKIEDHEIPYDNAESVDISLRDRIKNLHLTDARQKDLIAYASVDFANIGK